MINYGIIAANEYKELDNLLTHLTAKCDVKKEDIITVVDSDNTIDRQSRVHPDVIKVLIRHGVRFYLHPMKYDLGNLRNILRSYCINDWILYLDADEIPPPALIKILEKIPEDTPDVETVLIPRINLLVNDTDKPIPEGIQYPMDEKGRSNWPDYQERFLRNRVLWHKPIHPTPIRTGSVATLPADEAIALIHIKTVSGQIKRNKFYNSDVYRKKYEKRPGLLSRLNRIFKLY